MANKKKNTTKVKGEEFYTDEKGNILGKVQPSYNYETVTKTSKDAPYMGPTNTPAGSLSTNQASERAAEQVLNEAAVNPEEADKVRTYKNAVEKGGGNVSNKNAYKIVRNLENIPENDNLFQTPDSIAAKNLGLAGKTEEFSTPGEENTKAMEDSMNKRTENEKIEQEVIRDNPGASESEITNTTNMKKEQKDAEEKVKESKPDIGESFSSNITQTPFLGEEAGVNYEETPSGNTENKGIDWKSIYNEYMGPKNGADYVKALWNNGEYGKAVGNVLGNLLGSLGTINVGGASTGGRDFHSDWEDYRTNYTQAQKERNQTAFNNGMDLLKRAEMNQQDLEKQAGMNELDLSKREAMNTQDLDFLQKEVDKKLKMSKDLSAEDIALLQSFNTALNAGGISAALGSLGSKGIAKLAEILGL